MIDPPQSLHKQAAKFTRMILLINKAHAQLLCLYTCMFFIELSASHNSGTILSES